MEELNNGREVVAYYFKNYDYKLLKLFFISLLWRASVSTKPFYSKVNLGPFEILAKRMLLSNNSGNKDDFSTLLSLFVTAKGRDKLKKIILDPYLERWQGVNAYRFYLAGICAYIKVDKRVYLSNFREMVLRDQVPLYIVTRNLESSRDMQAMISIVKGAKI